MFWLYPVPLLLKSVLEYISTCQFTACWAHSWKLCSWISSKVVWRFQSWRRDLSWNISNHSSSFCLRVKPLLRLTDSTLTMLLPHFFYYSLFIYYVSTKCILTEIHLYLFFFHTCPNFLSFIQNISAYAYWRATFNLCQAFCRNTKISESIRYSYHHNCMWWVQMLKVCAITNSTQRWEAEVSLGCIWLDRLCVWVWVAGRVFEETISIKA